MILTWACITYTVVCIIALTLPSVNHISAEYSIGGLLIGFLWWLLYLRPRLARNTIGPQQSTPAPIDVPVTVGAEA